MSLLKSPGRCLVKTTSNAFFDFFQSHHVVFKTFYSYFKNEETYLHDSFEY